MCLPFRRSQPRCGGGSMMGARPVKEVHHHHNGGRMGGGMGGGRMGMGGMRMGGSRMGGGMMGGGRRMGGRRSRDAGRRLTSSIFGLVDNGVEEKSNQDVRHAGCVGS
ncbi:hypothetical protein F66182_1559 [Fusarium sp. NRRL 66182]|nr:hypothetical protein F66182_1559 [Fusarium sp. NRRL 66182]